MNKTIGIIIAAVVIIGGILYFTMRTPSTNDTTTTPTPSTTSSTTTTTTTTQQNTNAAGRVVFSVTDAAANMSDVSEINMKVSKVEMHNSTNGWVTASTTPHTYNLLDLNAKNESRVLADAQVKAGTYDQVRLMVDSISVKTKSGTTSEAKLPSGTLTLNTNVLVNPDMTSSVNFDFLADKSLHTTGNGKYIFAPVVKTETKSNAAANVNTDGTVSISGGHTDDSNTEGMDVDGSVKSNFQLDSKVKLDLDSNNMIKINL